MLQTHGREPGCFNLHLCDSVMSDSIYWVKKRRATAGARRITRGKVYKRSFSEIDNDEAHPVGALR
jgi:hypothetical protein